MRPAPQYLWKSVPTTDVVINLFLYYCKLYKKPIVSKRQPPKWVRFNGVHFQGEKGSPVCWRFVQVQKTAGRAAPPIYITPGFARFSCKITTI